MSETSKMEQNTSDPSEKKDSCACQTYLKVLSVFLVFCATAVFASLFLLYYFKYKNRVMVGLGKTICDTPDCGKTICDTPDCVMVAAVMAGMMNQTADPCHDFDLYACGNVYKGPDKVWTAINAGGKRNMKLIDSFLSEESKPHEWNYMKNMRNLYRACSDEDQMKEIGVQPFLDSNAAQEWPTLIGSNWNGEASFDVSEITARYGPVLINPFFIFFVLSSSVDSSRNALYLWGRNTWLDELPEGYLSRPRDGSSIMALETYFRDLAIELGADPVVAAEDARSIVDFEIKRSGIFSIHGGNNVTTLVALGKTYDYIDIPGVIRTTFGIFNIDISDDQEVIILNSPYFEKLEAILSSTSARTLQNLFGLGFAHSKASLLTKRLRALHFAYRETVLGKKEDYSTLCLNGVIDVFPLAVSKEFVRRTFSENAKVSVNVMYENLRTAFRSQVEKITWMGPKSKQKAYEKLAAMSRHIGYPDEEFNDEDIERKYASLTMYADDFYLNIHTARTYKIIENWGTLREPVTVSKNSWLATFPRPYQWQAEYRISHNAVIITAGLLQLPFFSTSLYDSITYGAIGSTIGHEITHGFDVQGSQYDENGDFHDWWQPEDLAEFKKRSQCFIHQYDGYKFESITKTVNGTQTLGENMADNGGLQQSYMAYKQVIAEKGGEPRQRLPGLALTDTQLFFLAAAQFNCEKYPVDNLRWQVYYGVHSPGRFRNIGAMQNSPEFAEAYDCPLGSPMNPETKCKVW